MSDKNRHLLCLLAFFFGVFGGHRFYAGRYVTAVLMLVTLGGFGIWAFVDLLFCITGEFKDRDGLKISLPRLPLGRRAFSVVAVILAVQGTGVLTGSGFAYTSARGFVSRATRAKGTITELREGQSEGTTHYYPTFTFDDDEG